MINKIIRLKVETVRAPVATPQNNIIIANIDRLAVNVNNSIIRNIQFLY